MLLFTGQVLAVASNDSTIKMYEVANGRVRHVFNFHHILHFKFHDDLSVKIFPVLKEIFVTVSLGHFLKFKSDLVVHRTIPRSIFNTDVSVIPSENLHFIL